MTLNSQEHIEIMTMFEREFRGSFRLDREDKSEWPKGHIYQHGEANAAFIAHRKGYAFAKGVYQ